MNRFKIVAMVAVFAALLAVRGFGQAESSSSSDAPLVFTNVPPPATRIEAMQLEKNTVIVRGYSEIGNIQGEDNSAIRVTALELTDVSKPAKEYGLVIDVHQSRGGDRIVTTYLDYDEIDPFITAMDYLGKLDNAITQMAGFEAAYRTKGDLSIGNFNNNGARIIAIKGVQIAPLTGQVGQATAFFPIGRLPELKQTILTAKDNINRVKNK